MKNQLFLSVSYHDLHQWTYENQWTDDTYQSWSIEGYDNGLIVERSYVPTTQEGAKHKSLITGIGLQRQRSTMRPNSVRILEGTNRSEGGLLIGHRK